MMNLLFGGMLLLSFVFAALTGRMEQLSAAAMGQAGEAVTLVLSLLGMLCLWSGLMKIAQESGLTELLCRALTPVTKRLFRGLNPRGEAAQAISMNLAANFLGLGNAATPLGIRAMCAMAKEQGANGRATDDMALFVILNTASMQLVPTTTAMLRMRAGAAAPLDFLPLTWVCSAGSIVAVVLMARALAPIWGKRR